MPVPYHPAKRGFSASVIDATLLLKFDERAEDFHCQLANFGGGFDADVGEE